MVILELVDINIKKVLKFLIGIFFLVKLDCEEYSYDGFEVFFEVILLKKNIRYGIRVFIRGFSL